MMWQRTYLGLLQRLDELKYQLPRSERRIAETVLDNPEIVSYMRLNELAQASDVSIATVHRFCRSMGCDGFKELRQEISRSVSAVAAQPATSNAPAPDSLPTVIGELNQSLSTLHTSVNEQSVVRASALLNAANRAILYTTDENYHSTVHEGTTLLYKAGLPCEPQLSEQSLGRTVPTLKKSDIAIFIVTERSPEPTNWMGPLKQFGGSTLSLAVGDTQASQSADVSIYIEHNPGNQYAQLITQVGLSVILTHLSQSILPA